MLRCAHKATLLIWRCLWSFYGALISCRSFIIHVVRRCYRLLLLSIQYSEELKSKLKTITITAPPRCTPFRTRPSACSEDKSRLHPLCTSTCTEDEAAPWYSVHVGRVCSTLTSEFGYRSSFPAQWQSPQASSSGSTGQGPFKRPMCPIPTTHSRYVHEITFKFFHLCCMPVPRGWSV